MIERIQGLNVITTLQNNILLIRPAPREAHRPFTVNVIMHSVYSYIPSVKITSDVIRLTSHDDNYDYTLCNIYYYIDSLVHYEDRVTEVISEILSAERLFAFYIVNVSTANNTRRIIIT